MCLDHRNSNSTIDEEDQHNVCDNAVINKFKDKIIKLGLMNINLPTYAIHSRYIIHNIMIHNSLWSLTAFCGLAYTFR